ncbi:hypothetical protein HJD18_08205 [Thermoleophilia bacterium SCSIO 60948]|nr:hypothetical protein HJD18_08205 [Thermoleophilia bacterium SCSIO 60948]
MMSSSQLREEEHFRLVEKGLLFVDDAARQLGRIAGELQAEGADPALVAGLTEAAENVRAEHRRLMKSVYFRAPSADQQDLLTGAQDRLAS